MASSADELDVELAVLRARHGSKGGLISISRVGANFVARIAYVEEDRPEDWLQFWVGTEPLHIAGGGGTSYDGDLWFHSMKLGQVDDPTPKDLGRIRASVDGVVHDVRPAPLAELRSGKLDDPATWFAFDETWCQGCGRVDSAAFCEECRSAIHEASIRSSEVAQMPNQIVPLGVVVGEVNGADIVLVDIEIYGRLSLLRTWWGVEAADDEPLEGLRSPLNRRLLLTTDAGDELVVAPGSSWNTDGRGVETGHRAIGVLDAGCTMLRIQTPDGVSLDVTIDLARAT